jgi:Protein of unknown function (DUF3040)
MDDDPVLRSLADDLERDDPRLAALLEGRSHGRRHAAAWSLFALALLALPLFLPLGQVLGVLAIVLIIGSPLAVCWLIS